MRALAAVQTIRSKVLSDGWLCAQSLPHSAPDKSRAQFPVLGRFTGKLFDCRSSHRLIRAFEPYKRGANTINSLHLEQGIFARVSGIQSRLSGARGNGL